MNRFGLCPVWCLLAIGCLSPSAQAATSANIPVSATVTAGCLVIGGTSNYGTLDFGSASSLATSTLTAALPGVVLQCTPGVSLTMTVDGGQHNVSGRRLQRVTGGTQQIGYALFRDAGLTQSLGISQSVAVAYSDAANISLPVYGRLVLPGNLPAGQYSDVLQVTLSW
jgi:spore coat protein U-like protein